MATHRHIDAICLVLLALTLLLTLLFINGKALGIRAVLSEENSDSLFTANDLAADWDTAGATRIALSDAGSTVQGNGAYVRDGNVYIVGAGRYVLSGALSDGSLIIETEGDDKIWLMLQGVSIHCEGSAALCVRQAGKVFLTLQEGSENTLSCGDSFCEEAVLAGVDGAIYSKDDLTINGAGALWVRSGWQHGIVCNDDLVLAGGTLHVTAAQDALHAHDSVRIREADVTLSAGDDGITAANDDETAFLYMESGRLSILSCCEGLEAVRITIAGGELTIAATDDGINANGDSGRSLIDITGGRIALTVENGRDADGLDSNKDITISGGELLISVSDTGGNCAIDYGSENGGRCVITGGTVLACGGSGMAEGFDAASPQGFLMRSVSAPAATTVTLKDDEGNELLSKTVPCSFSSLLISTPGMTVGDSCTLTVGESEMQLTVDNSSAPGGFGGFGGFGGAAARGHGDRAGEAAAGHGGFGRPGGPPEGSLPEDGLPENGLPEGSAPENGLPEGGTPGGEGAAAPFGPQNGGESTAAQPGDPPAGPAGRYPDGQGGPQPGEKQADGAGAAPSPQALLLLAASAAVLLAGCVIAARYKRKG